MADDHSDAIQVNPEDLYDPAGKSAVHVDNIEEVHPSEGQKDDSKAQVQQNPDAVEQSTAITHETPQLKTTYDTQDEQLSTTSKIKAKLVHIGDKLRPQEAVEAKNADPHPSLK